MKKILIVNNNMKVGGVQKSLYNLLWTLGDSYDVTLMLFRKTGAYLEQLPPGIKVLETKSLFRFLGLSQGQCSGPDKLKRGFLAAVCRLFGRPAVMKLLLASQKTLPEHYHCAIAFLQNGNRKNFYGGVQEFVLHRVSAEKKAAFIHCDYRSSGANNPENNALLKQFDRIAACSDGCRRALLEILPELAEKTVTVRNCHRCDEIRAMAADPVRYDAARCNVLMVTRLAHEKGIERAIRAVSHGIRQGLPVSLHLVGSGAMEASLKDMTREQKLDEAVHFYGEQPNPYRFMQNADLLMVSSYHEAAPMVIEEARCLGLPVLTVKTTSSHEMVTQSNCGWVCENSQTGLENCLVNVLSDWENLKKMKEKMRMEPVDNALAIRQFHELIEG